jgi:DNA invertase Pin-like site-specific DNA recombinase
VIIGYARVSTRGQVTTGNSLEEQENTLTKNGCEIVHKEGYSGSTTDRPIFTQLLSSLKDGDTLMVTKLDRFARSTIQGCTIAQELIDRGIKVNILNMGMLDNTPASTLMRTIFFAFAQFEREMIAERTQEGKAIARTKVGYREGRKPKFAEFYIESALNLLDTNSYKEVERQTKISKSTLIRAKRKRVAYDKATI